MSHSLQGKRVVITGAGGAIGRAAWSKLEAMGARVCGIDVQADGVLIGADVRDAEAVAGAIIQAAERLGGIDILVNNAGIGTAQDAGTTPDREARATIDVNLVGSWIVTSAAMPHLLRGDGHVVNVASGLALLTMPYSAAYSASKRALAAYSDVLRLEYRGRLTVTTLYPGYIRTPIHEGPAARGISLEGVVPADTVEQAAAAIVRACRRRERDISTSRRTGLGLKLARHFPRLTDAVVSWRLRSRHVAGGLSPADGAG
jgi:NAD(P)-dependent dehydrogenase (short-subunit alcohol dehydrogenase family)